jgi:hypothetical protein
MFVSWVGIVNVSLSGELTENSLSGYGVPITYTDMTYIDIRLGCSSPLQCNNSISILSTSIDTSIVFVDLNNGASNSVSIGGDDGLDHIHSSIIINSSLSPNGTSNSYGCHGSFTIDDRKGKVPLDITVSPSIVTGVSNRSTNISIPSSICSFTLYGSPMNDIITIDDIRVPTFINGYDGNDHIIAASSLESTNILSLYGNNGADQFTIYTNGAVNSTIRVDDETNDNQVDLYSSILLPATEYLFTDNKIHVIGSVNNSQTNEIVEYNPTIGTLIVHGSNGNDRFTFNDMTTRLAIVYGYDGDDRYASCPLYLFTERNI